MMKGIITLTIIISMFIYFLFIAIKAKKNMVWHERARVISYNNQVDTSLNKEPVIIVDDSLYFMFNSLTKSFEKLEKRN